MKFMNATRKFHKPAKSRIMGRVSQATVALGALGGMLLSSAFATASSATTGTNIADGICTVTYNIGVPVIFAIGVLVLIRGIIAMANSRDGILGLGVGAGMIVMALFAKDIVNLAYEIAPSTSTFKTSMAKSKCIVA